jgi:hypothetical protein
VSDRLISAMVGTSGLAPSANLPVRIYTTGTKQVEVVAVTGGEDAKVVGIARRGVATIGFPLAVLNGYHDTFLGKVNTTVVAGQKLCIKDRSQLRVVATAANRFVAQVLVPRTNAGVTWLAFVPNGVV